MRGNLISIKVKIHQIGQFSWKILQIVIYLSKTIGKMFYFSIFSFFSCRKKISFFLGNFLSTLFHLVLKMHLFSCTYFLLKHPVDVNIFFEENSTLTSFFSIIINFFIFFILIFKISSTEKYFPKWNHRINFFRLTIKLFKINFSFGEKGE